MRGEKVTGAMPGSMDGKLRAGRRSGAERLAWTGLSMIHDFSLSTLNPRFRVNRPLV